MVIVLVERASLGEPVRARRNDEASVAELRDASGGALFPLAVRPACERREAEEKQRVQLEPRHTT